MLNKMITTFKDQVFKIPQVVRIEISKNGSGIDVWTFLKERDIEVRDEIYDIELNLIQRFNNLQFNFHVVSDSKRTFPHTETIYSK